MRRLKMVTRAVRWVIEIGFELEFIVVWQRPNFVSKTPSRIFYIEEDEK